MEHKYITCTGYGGTGSSVISDLMKEFDNVKSCGADFEMTIAFDHHGISDLQHYIIDDFERNKVSEGIFDFIEHVKQISPNYDRHLGIDFESIMEKYIRNIIDVEWLGFTVQHLYRYPRWQRIIMYRIPSIIQSFLIKYNDGYEHSAKYKRKLPIRISYGENNFYNETQKMYRVLLDSFDKSYKCEYLCFDQLVPAYNFERYLRYFPNLKVIVVDRDPRDLYLLNELYWHEGWIPSHNIDIFIKWFKLIREDRNYNNVSNVLFVNFEEGICNYDLFVDKITDFIGLDKSAHSSPQQYFNPTVSKKNYKLWQNCKSKVKEIDKIHKELESFCWNE